MTEYQSKPVAKDYSGMIYNELMFIKPVGMKVYPSGQKSEIWELNCTCGQLCKAPSRQVISGRKKSCGHLAKHPRVKTHGGSRGKSGTPEWRTWRAMRNRCNNPHDSYYNIYGGRGISVCERWQASFPNFLEDMGHKPSLKHELDRIDSNKNYCPENCRWATRKEQANNTRQNVFIEYDGQRLTIAQWAETLGLNYHTLYTRIHKRDWTLERALNASLR